MTSALHTDVKESKRDERETTGVFEENQSFLESLMKKLKKLWKRF